MDLTQNSVEEPAIESIEPPCELSVEKQKIQSLQTEVDQLKRQLAWFKREVFGQKSERREGDGNPQ